jgi:ribosomal protein S18 acetylase RimI-like enzyme
MNAHTSLRFSVRHCFRGLALGCLAVAAASTHAQTCRARVNLNENETTPVPTEDWTIRPLASADRATVLRLNAENRPALAALEAVDPDELLAYDGHHLVDVDPMGEVVGFLLSFPRKSRYGDSEINELRQRVSESFYSIYQVAIAATRRGRGIGRVFWSREGVCEVGCGR